MSVLLTVNGVAYPYPEPLDENWGQDATNWASAVTSGMLQKAGGTFTLTADVDFGASFGLKSLYYKSRSANLASAGVLRLARTDTFGWRNQANDGDLLLSVNASNVLLFNGSPLDTGVTTIGTIDSETPSANGAVINGVNLVLQSASGTVPGLVNLTTQTMAGAKTFSTSVLSPIFSTNASNPASAGVVRLANNTNVAWRNNGNNGDLPLTVTTADRLAFNTKAVLTLDSTDTVTNKTMSGASNTFSNIPYSALVLTDSIVNADINSAAGIAYSKLNLTGSIVNTDIGASAAIAYSKLAALTSANILVGSAGNVATVTAVTGDVTISNTGVTAIGTNKVTNTMLAQMAESTIKGRAAASGTGNAVDLTATQATAILNNVVGDSGSGGTKGLVPAPGAGDTAANKFLRADAIWTTPSVAPTFSYRSITGTDTALTSDYGLALSGASFTLTLYTGTSNQGRILELTHAGTTLTQNYTIATAGGQLIYGNGYSATSFVMYTNGERLRLQVDASGNFLIISHDTITPWAAYTPTAGGLGTVSAVEFRWRRVGDSAEIIGALKTGTVAAAPATLTLPGGSAIDFNKLPASWRNYLGILLGGITTSAASTPATTRGPWYISSKSTATTTVFLGTDVDLDAEAADALFDEQNASSTAITSNAGIAVKFTVPISGWNP